VTNRIIKVNELLKQEIGQLLLRRGDVPEGALATITRVEATPNLQEARVYMSVMPEEKTKEVFSALRLNVYDIQQDLNHRLKMRPVPRIKWIGEKQTAKAQRIEEIMDHIKGKEEEKK